MSEQERSCLVCTAPTNYAHLGVNSCRSCSDFYRRTVAANRTYVCRQAAGQCVVKPSMREDRHNCRGCRFQRCQKMGMKIGNETECALTKKTEAGSFLQRILSENKASVEQRKVCEFTLQPILHRRIMADFEEENLLLCTWSYLLKYLDVYAGGCMNYANALFHEFAKLSPSDQRLMLKYCATRSYLTEQHSNTFIKFGTHFQPFFMATLTTVYDDGQFEFLTEEAGPQMSTEFAKQMRYNKAKVGPVVDPILKRSQFTATEYAVMYALSLWPIDASEDLPEHLIGVCYSVRRRILGALREYYVKELKLSDYSVRLGNLLTYEHVINEAKCFLNDEVQAYSLLGMLDRDIDLVQRVMTISL